MFPGDVRVGFLFRGHDFGPDVQLVAVEGVAWLERLRLAEDLADAGLAWLERVALGQVGAALEVLSRADEPCGVCHAFFRLDAEAVRAPGQADAVHVHAA